MKSPISLSLFLASFSVFGVAEESDNVDEIIVISPLANTIPNDAPYLTQFFNAADINNDRHNSLADLLDKNALGVSINQAQNNPLQPDLQIRGYSASPLLGAAQGVAVYLNGVRINESFGDTVNFDLLAPNALAGATLLSGANPSYGLNALGGSLALTTKTGFNSEGGSLGYGAGSFDRQRGSFSFGDNNGSLGYFLALNSFTENGWRDFSATEAYNLYGAVSGRAENSGWDITVFLSDTDLRGNGAAPEGLLDGDFEAVFTHPDITENNLAMLSGRWQKTFNQGQQLTINGFFRNLDTDSFNGDGSEFEECPPPLDGDILCEDDETETVLDQFGNTVDESFDAINNISRRNQDTYGVTAEWNIPWADSSINRQSTFGFDYYTGDTEFDSVVEFARLQNDRSTSRSGLFADEFATELESSSKTVSVYWLERFNWSDKLRVDLSWRYNRNWVDTDDTSGEHPELNGNHTFNTVNLGVGGHYQLNDRTSWYAGLFQSSRTPTPIELACSDAGAPCSLPNTFLADPPLDEIIARNLEVGFQQTGANNWQISAFISTIDDDIIFQSTGGVSANEGFFDNVSDTQRLGISAQWQRNIGSVDWTVNTTWLQATFEDDFFVSSPNHPDAIDGLIPVNSGDDIPGLPDLQVSLQSSWAITTKISWDLSLHFQSGVYLRGDEGNLDDKTDSFVIADSALYFQASEKLNLSLSINNLFDREFETFGLFGEPDEVLPELGDDNTRFLSPSEPRNIRLSLQYDF